MRESHACGLKDIDLTHQGHFLKPDSQIRTNYPLTRERIMNIQFKKALIDYFGFFFVF